MMKTLYERKESHCVQILLNRLHFAVCLQTLIALWLISAALSVLKSKMHISLCPQEISH